MSRIEHCGKNELANCFRNFGRKDLKDSAVKNVQKKWKIQQEQQNQQGLQAVANICSQIFVAIIAKTCFHEQKLLAEI